MSDANEQILKEFLIESFENLSDINHELLELEKDSGNEELLNKIYRSMHTLKGSSSFLGFNNLQSVTHAAESVLDLLREKKLALNSKVSDVLLRSFDVCQDFLKEIESSGKEPAHSVQEMVTGLQDIINDPDKYLENRGVEAVGESNENGYAGFENEMSKKDRELVKENLDAETTSILNFEPKEVLRSSKVELQPEGTEKQDEGKVELSPTTPDLSSSESKEEKEMGAGNTAPLRKEKNLSDSVIRVNVNLLDKIMNVVGELVLNRNQILVLASKLANQQPEFYRLSQQLNVITTELQADIMTTRMQPVGNVLTKFERIVRDLARKVDKKVDLSIIGKETELDKTLLQAINDPLTHIVRNAIDHGIETPNDRTAKGKKEAGNLSIRAYHEGGQVIIEIADDGKGIDTESITQKAIEKGIIKPDQVSKLTDHYLINLIFHPGFSTAKQVTNISGRGVGMDVVKSNIEKIGGVCEVSSELGSGSVFKLKIPLTLAIIPALMVKSFKECFAIPQLNLVELVRVDEDQVATKIEKVQGGEFYRLRGDLIPILRLNNLLELEKVHEKSEKLRRIVDKRKTEETEVETRGDLTIAVLNAEGTTYGLIIDEILDTQEIVVKALSRVVKQVGIFAGSTIMGDGQVALILDVYGLYTKFFRIQEQIEEISEEEKLADVSFKTTNYVSGHEVLLFKLNDTRVYGIPLFYVNRLEEFSSKKIEMTGGQHVIKYRNTPVQIVNLENKLKLETENHWQTRYERGEDFELSCFIIQQGEKFFALAVNEILDIEISDGEISTAVVDRDELLGTVFIKGNTISLLNIEPILENKSEKKKAIAKSGKGYKIVLVEDSSLYRKLVGEALEELGHTVIYATNGEEGFKALEKTSNVDAVITDIEMPIMNGVELTQKIRSIEKYKNLIVMALTSKNNEMDKAKSKKAGANEYLVKFNKEEVREMLIKHLAS